MKAEELRVGDLVKRSSPYEKINPLYSVVKVVDGKGGQILHEEVYEDGTVINCITPCNKLSEIPLTEKLILNNGWKQTSEENECLYYRYKGVYIGFDMDIGSFFVERSYGNKHYIYGVHELQHVLWAFGLDADFKLID